MTPLRCSVAFPGSCREQDPHPTRSMGEAPARGPGRSRDASGVQSDAAGGKGRSIMAIRRAMAMSIVLVLAMVLASAGLFTPRAEAAGSCWVGASCLFKNADYTSDQYNYYG